MDELLDRLVAKVGVDRGVAEKAVGIILAFLLKEGPSDKVQALINQMPGAEAVMQAAAGDGGMGMGGIMGVGTKLMTAFCEEASKRGLQFVYLTTDRDSNEPSNLFYLRHGFEAESEILRHSGRVMIRYVRPLARHGNHSS